VVADTPCVSLFVFDEVDVAAEVGFSGVLVLYSLLAIWLLMESGISQK